MSLIYPWMGCNDQLWHGSSFTSGLGHNTDLGWVKRRAQGWWWRIHRATGGRDPARGWGGPGGPGGEVYNEIRGRGGRVWGHTSTPRQKQRASGHHWHPLHKLKLGVCGLQLHGIQCGYRCIQNSKSKQIALEIKVGMKINLLVLHAPGCLLFWNRKLKMIECRFVSINVLLPLILCKWEFIWDWMKIPWPKKLVGIWNITWHFILRVVFKCSS